MSESVLTMNQVEKRYRNVPVLQDITMEIPRGSIYGLVGSNGAGKSTLMRLISGQTRIDRGEIRLFGKIPEKKEQRVRRRIGTLIEEPGFYGDLSARQNLEYYRLQFGIPEKETISRLLDMVGLPKNCLGRYPHEFSGGQRQRIGIARALSLNPRLLVCDEPVSALDVSIQAQILNLLRDLQKELGLTCIFIGHGLGAVNYVSDRIAVMYLGKMVEIADRKELFDHPLHPYSRALFEAVPIADPRKRRKRSEGIVGGETASNVNTPSGCPFHPRCPHCKGECMSGEMELRPAVPGSSHLTACIRYKELEKEVEQA